MKLKEKSIGSIHTAKAENGTTVTVTILDDKRMFKLYRKLKLDVFEDKKAKRESTESND